MSTVEALLVLVGSWWWVAPAAAALGVTGYSALTAGKRRARRLELDAARHEEQRSRAALAAAHAEVRSAQALVLTAKSQQYRPLPGGPALGEAKRHLQGAKQTAKAAALELRASRSRLKAIAAQQRVSPPGGPLPIDQLIAQHDAVTARWLEYETDPTYALAFPQILDAQHPSTRAFLEAQQNALRLRPTANRSRVTPAEYLAYRDAIRAAEAAFDAAETEALRAASGPPVGTSAGPRSTPAAPPRDVPPPPAAPPRDAAAPGAPPRIWPVPSRTPRGPSAS